MRIKRKEGIAMGYLRALAETIFWYIPFSFLLSAAFNVIQIPFAVIHKNAVRLVLVVRTYYLCQFFSVMTRANQNFYEISALPMVIAFSIFLFCSGIRVTKLDRRMETDGDVAFFFALGVLSVPAYIALYYFKIFFLIQPIQWFVDFEMWLLALPVVGAVLRFLLQYVVVLALLPYAAYLVIGACVLIGNLRKKKIANSTPADGE